MLIYFQLYKLGCNQHKQQLAKKHERKKHRAGHLWYGTFDSGEHEQSPPWANYWMVSLRIYRIPNLHRSGKYRILQAMVEGKDYHARGMSMPRPRGLHRRSDKFDRSVEEKRLSDPPTDTFCARPRPEPPRLSLWLFLFPTNVDIFLIL